MTAIAILVTPSMVNFIIPFLDVACYKVDACLIEVRIKWFEEKHMTETFLRSYKGKSRV